MTYNQLSEEAQMGFPSASKTEHAAMAVLHGGIDNLGLHDRNFFDLWWKRIEPNIQDEIFQEMVRNIEEGLK